MVRKPTATGNNKFLSTLSLRRATSVLHRSAPLQQEFLSTLSLRRATLFFIGLHLFNRNFYPRSPCGERHPTQQRKTKTNEFLSTLSLRRATNARPETRQRDAISIHALLAESDHQSQAESHQMEHFYPRSPCGERQGFPD